jgi:hypothetical protein
MTPTLMVTVSGDAGSTDLHADATVPRADLIPARAAQ